MQIIHLTSFQGNSGDTVNHTAFHFLFRKYIDSTAEFNCVEIRQFYRNANNRYFDDNFVREINSHDLLVLGGGLHFDARWSESATGTTLDFSDEFIDAIKIPVLINAMGYAERIDNLNPSEEDWIVFNKFEAFIRNIHMRSNWFLTLRNDGSVQRIAKRYGDAFASYFDVVPDTGFFFDKTIVPYQFDETRTTIGFCVANDTFTQDSTYLMDIGHMNQSIVKCMKQLIDNGHRILLFAHIPKDFETLNILYSLLGDRHFRFHVVVAPYNPLDATAARTLVSYYKACDCVVPMRFHANIIPMQNGICTVGLSVAGIICSERIPPLYTDAGLEDFSLSLDTHDPLMSEKLYDKIGFALQNREVYKATASATMQLFEERIEVYLRDVKLFLQGQNGK